MKGIIFFLCKILKMYTLLNTNIQLYTDIRLDTDIQPYTDI